MDTKKKVCTKKFPKPSLSHHNGKTFMLLLSQNRPPALRGKL